MPCFARLITLNPGRPVFRVRGFDNKGHYYQDRTTGPIQSKTQFAKKIKQGVVPK